MSPPSADPGTGSRASSQVLRPLLRIMLSGLLLVLAACSVVRTVYNQAPNLAYWQLNRAFHLDDEQADQVKHNLYAFFQWHRRTELPVYARLLNRAALEAQGPITPELACERRAEFEKVGRRSIDKAVPMLAELLRSLKPEQVQNLRNFIDDLNEDFRDDFLDGDKADRDEAWGKYALKWAEFFYGKFSKAQRAALIQGVVTGPLSAQDVYTEMLRTQGELLQIARHAATEHPAQAEVEQALRTLFQDIFEPPTEARRLRLAKWINAGCMLASSTHNATTVAQRNKVTETMSDWEGDVRILSAQL
ncbi:MAG: hypothetical protein EKK47_09710 [Burkholderiales bacterium]|nr:MAG: hypothetical protein EKK47_09710 [Burkholderiales bacterium]